MTVIGFVTWNRITLTRHCLEALIQRTEGHYRLFVADNASTDGTPDYLLDMLNQRKIHRLLLFDRNYGIAPASNSLWELAGDTDFVKIDNDIEVRRNDWLIDMQNAVRVFPGIGMLAFSFRKQLHNIEYPLATPVPGLTLQNPAPYTVGGGCVMIPAATKKILGVWCEDYAPYGEEDADYSQRLYLAGAQPWCLADTDYMYHHNQVWDGSFPDEAYYADKQKRRRENTGSGGRTSLNVLMYRQKLRPLKMRRRFITIIDDNGIQARMIPNPPYYELEMKLVRHARNQLSIPESR